jgi:hypothetical protein
MNLAAETVQIKRRCRDASFALNQIPALKGRAKFRPPLRGEE